MTPYDITNDDGRELINRREAILRVTALLGGIALVGSDALLSGCRAEPNTDAPFTADEVAFLDEVADTMLPPTKTPGAKAAKTGAFMALIVTDSYGANDRKIFREGMRKLDDASRKANNVSFMAATPAQRLSVLQAADREQQALDAARRDAQQKKYKAMLTDVRTEAQPSPTDAGVANAITAEPPAHYFRMMKELALLGYFTSEIGCTQAQRYVETPGRFEPCVPYHVGDKAWAAHA
jgi:Gluconate 2-dehydrogenase subunit 3